MYYYYIDVDTGYEYNSWQGELHSAATLNEAIRKGKNLLIRHIGKYDEANVVISKSDSKERAYLQKNVVGIVGYHAKHYYPHIVGKVYTYTTKNSYKAYEILADGSRGRLIWDGKTRTKYI